MFRDFRQYFVDFSVNRGIISGIDKRFDVDEILDDIPTVSLIFNRLDSWQQLFNVLGWGNGSRGYHLCA